MFTVVLGKPNRLFHQNRSQDSTLILVLLNAVLTVSHWYSFFFIVRDYHRHFTRWLICMYVSCPLNFVALKCSTYFNSLLNWTPAFAHLRTHSLKFFLCFNLHEQVFTYINKRSALCQLDFDKVSAILQTLHIRALLSRSSRKMKFDSTSGYVKADLLRFWDNVRVFLQTTHFVKSRAHSPRPTSKIIAMIALRRVILMKADPLVGLHAHRLFSGRACSCKRDRCCSWIYKVRSSTVDTKTKYLCIVICPKKFTLADNLFEVTELCGTRADILKPTLDRTLLALQITKIQTKSSM